MISLSAVIIVKNEEKNIAECLRALSFCDEIIVVDSGSQDRTVTIAEELGAKVYFNPFKDFASQKNFGISKSQGQWVLLVDADERVSPELADEIKKVLANKPDAEGFFLRRQNRIFGRWMKHGSNGNDLQLRLCRKEKAFFQGRVHERIFLEGKTRVLKNHLFHHSTETMSEYMTKLNHYTSFEAQGLLDRKEVVKPKSMLKRPVFFFLYLQFWKKGFMDGVEGFIFNFLSAYYQFISRAKQWELESKGKAAS